MDRQMLLACRAIVALREADGLVPSRHVGPEALRRKLMRRGIIRGKSGPKGGYELTVTGRDADVEGVWLALYGDDEHLDPWGEWLAKYWRGIPIENLVEMAEKREKAA